MPKQRKKRRSKLTDFESDLNSATKLKKYDPDELKQEVHSYLQEKREQSSDEDYQNALKRVIHSRIKIDDSVEIIMSHLLPEAATAEDKQRALKALETIKPNEAWKPLYRRLKKSVNDYVVPGTLFDESPKALERPNIVEEKQKDRPHSIFQQWESVRQESGQIGKQEVGEEKSQVRKHR